MRQRSEGSQVSSGETRVLGATQHQCADTQAQLGMEAISSVGRVRRVMSVGRVCNNMLSCPACLRSGASRFMEFYYSIH